MFKIFDGRDSFYQWDINQRLLVEDETIQEVHFCNKTDDEALVCEVYTEDGKRVVNVPNILLQDNWDVCVYAFCGYTKYSSRFKIKARSKPADYIYTETEIKSVEKVVKEALESEEFSTANLRFYTTGVNYKKGEYVLAVIEVANANVYAVYECLATHTVAISEDITKSSNWRFIRYMQSYTAKADANGKEIHSTYATKEENKQNIKSLVSGVYYNKGDYVLAKTKVNGVTMSLICKCKKAHTSNGTMNSTNWDIAERITAENAINDEKGNNIFNTYAPLSMISNFKIVKLAPNETFDIKPNMLIMAMSEGEDKCVTYYTKDGNDNRVDRVQKATMVLFFTTNSNKEVEGEIQEKLFNSMYRVGCMYYTGDLSGILTGKSPFGVKNHFVAKPTIINESSNSKDVYVYYIEQGGNK